MNLNLYTGNEQDNNNDNISRKLQIKQSNIEWAVTFFVEDFAIRITTLLESQ